MALSHRVWLVRIQSRPKNPDLQKYCTAAIKSTESIDGGGQATSSSNRENLEQESTPAVLECGAQNESYPFPGYLQSNLRVERLLYCAIVQPQIAVK